VNLGLIIGITHRFEILHPLLILNPLLQLSQYGIGGSDAFATITLAQLR